jgi:hypothetical protein
VHICISRCQRGEQSRPCRHLEHQTTLPPHLAIDHRSLTAYIVSPCIQNYIRLHCITHRHGVSVTHGIHGVPMQAAQDLALQQNCEALRACRSHMRPCSNVTLCDAHISRCCGEMSLLLVLCNSRVLKVWRRAKCRLARNGDLHAAGRASIGMCCQIYWIVLVC